MFGSSKDVGCDVHANSTSGLSDVSGTRWGAQQGDLEGGQSELQHASHDTCAIHASRSATPELSLLYPHRTLSSTLCAKRCCERLHEEMPENAAATRQAINVGSPQRVRTQQTLRCVWCGLRMDWRAAAAGCCACRNRCSCRRERAFTLEMN